MINFPATTGQPTDGTFTHTENEQTWYWDGITWRGVGGGGAAASGSFVEQTDPTGAAVMPAGGDATRPSTPLVGYTRWNGDRNFLEVYTSSGWNQLDYIGAPDTLPPDLIITANTELNDGYYVCNNFVLNAGVTVTTKSQAIVIECAGTATINGTINVDQAGAIGGVSIRGNNDSTIPCNIGSGFGGGRPLSFGRSYPAFLSLIGSGGASGNAATIGAGSRFDSPVGGAGGGGFALKAAKQVTLGSAGLITANGTNAAAPSASASSALGSWWSTGAGGGSGGVVVLRSAANIVIQGSISVKGGNGSGPGQSGSLTAGLNGGGGGGGGIVILQADGGVTNTGTITLTGGIAGAYFGTGDFNGAGGGGGCGGRGGSGATSVNAGGPQINGSNGLLLYSGSPI
jgi:hypothetical protein